MLKNLKTILSAVVAILSAIGGSEEGRPVEDGAD